MTNEHFLFHHTLERKRLLLKYWKQNPIAINHFFAWQFWSILDYGLECSLHLCCHRNLSCTCICLCRLNYYAAFLLEPQ